MANGNVKKLIDLMTIKVICMSTFIHIMLSSTPILFFLLNWKY